MKNYEKPVVLANNEMSEGVYAASGDCCWQYVDYRTEEKTEKSTIAYYFDLYHNSTEGHGNEEIHLTVTFSVPVTISEANNCTYNVNGSIVTIIIPSDKVSNPTEKWTASLEVAPMTATVIGTPSVSKP